ncbi:DUF411 domain-containing protein [Neptunomonas concharum]|uniref:DUF411 domain-containing protein n=1 Tax=Neptunomonas concharum TaxID=1031538 RepID=A0A5P1RA92_9GAMM|nr:DUF411 domain-containing protein [Neptunomonas concharum]QEQ96540.1 DUF411 domain-containing protein [Neptunomonas concharum]
MSHIKRHFAVAAGSLILSIAIVGCTDSTTQANTAAAVEKTTNTPTSLVVYKSPTCGCCGAWIEHAEQRGIATKAVHPENLTAEKQRWGVEPQYASCHTAVSKEGYVFEGHVPVRLVEKFLNEKPEGARGLAVPGMPAGSPGMEMGDQFTPYDVLLLKEDGSSEVYAHISQQQEQY